MNKALWAVPAVALLGTAGVVGVIVASPGGEEEVVQQPATATGTVAAPLTPTMTPASSATPESSLTPTPAASLTPTPTTGALPTCPTGRTGPRTRAPSTSEESKRHTDASFGYSLALPVEWTACQVAFDSQIPDFVSATELHDQGGLLRVSVYVFGNQMNLTLEDWIKAHDSLFLGVVVETRTIGGKPALVAPVNWEGFPAPLAYILHRDYVVSIGGWHTDFDAVAPTLAFDQ